MISYIVQQFWTLCLFKFKFDFVPNTDAWSGQPLMYMLYVNVKKMFFIFNFLKIFLILNVLIYFLFICFIFIYF